MAFRKGLKEWNSAREAFVDFSTAEKAEIPEGPDTQQWLPSPKVEGDIVIQLNQQIEQLMKSAYGNINNTIENFYQKLEENGIRDFSRMEPLELERLILDIQKVIFVASDIVAELYNDAYWADRVQQDEYWQAYREPKSVKAKEDRQSFAMQETRDSRFFYYYRFMVWRRLSEKLSALKDLQKTLEFYRQRVQKDRF